MFSAHQLVVCGLGKRVGWFVAKVFFLFSSHHFCPVFLSSSSVFVSIIFYYCVIVSAQFSSISNNFTFASTEWVHMYCSFNVRMSHSFAWKRTTHLDSKPNHSCLSQTFWSLQFKSKKYLCDFLTCHSLLKLVTLFLTPLVCLSSSFFLLKLLSFLQTSSWCSRVAFLPCWLLHLCRVCLRWAFPCVSSTAIDNARQVIDLILSSIYMSWCTCSQF